MLFCLFLLIYPSSGVTLFFFLLNTFIVFSLYYGTSSGWYNIKIVIITNTMTTCNKLFAANALIGTLQNYLETAHAHTSAATVRCIALHFITDKSTLIFVAWVHGVTQTSAYHRLYGWKTRCWLTTRPPLAPPLWAPRAAAGRPASVFHDCAPIGLLKPLQK